MKLFNLFSKSSSDKESETKYIFHFQKLLAYQQLFTERYNDAFAKIANLGTLSNEAFLRPSASLNNPEAIEKHLIPVLKEKIKILNLMESEHKEIGEPQSNSSKVAYHNLTNQLHIMKERAHLQYEGFTVFIDDSDNIDVTKLDDVELEAMDQTIFSLNDVIADLKLNGDDFLEINCNAFNSVRKNIGLSSLSDEQFQEIYFAGISGQPARFFNFD